MFRFQVSVQRPDSLAAVPLHLHSQILELRLVRSLPSVYFTIHYSIITQWFLAV
jgi:hypothetical protein